MKPNFELSRTQRKIVGSFLENYSLEQLNVIPTGFTNNLFWNIAHIVVTQQLLVYKLSGLPMIVSDELVEKYKKGTSVTAPATAEELAEVKRLLTETIAQTEKDYANGLFKNYSDYPTSTGYVITSAEDAIDFNSFHEGLHIGVMMSIRKFV
ncbi:DinB family protein [Flavobacterium sp. NG2]|uniref:DinB family protein n=1 Tax=Flavobacterium sp. NG2 TaxID=3097547 RepID=UPI002A806F70|nr:DinB family protein [Flavobacterium sp. NG2]WPR72358.1 DinB family protein [Flavobacterium sp. NG2]